MKTKALFVSAWMCVLIAIVLQCYGYSTAALITLGVGLVPLQALARRIP